MLRSFSLGAYTTRFLNGYRINTSTHCPLPISIQYISHAIHTDMHSGAFAGTTQPIAAHRLPNMTTFTSNGNAPSWRDWTLYFSVYFLYGSIRFGIWVMWRTTALANTNSIFIRCFAIELYWHCTHIRLLSSYTYIWLRVLRIRTCSSFSSPQNQHKHRKLYRNTHFIIFFCVLFVQFGIEC